MHDFALNVCCKCKRKEWLHVTQEDRDYAKNMVAILYSLGMQYE
jgi:hypothetical protein